MIKKKIILFRFHSEFDICAERVKIWKYYNPDIPIYGLYGGDKSEWKNAVRKFSKLPIENMQISASEDSYWKWLHPEQTLAEWFTNFGYKLDFDYLFDEEWDILPIDSIENIYKNLPDETSIALTGVEEFDRVKSRWRWVIDESHRVDYLKFEKYIFDEFKTNLMYATLGPGQIFTKKFLKDFSNLKLDMKVIDPIVSEMVYPIAAQILKYRIIDTGIYPGWGNRDKAIKYFNCWYIPINKTVVEEELRKKNGVKVFHPIKYQFYLNNLR